MLVHIARVGAPPCVSEYVCVCVFDWLCEQKQRPLSILLSTTTSLTCTAEQQPQSCPRTRQLRGSVLLLFYFLTPRARRKSRSLCCRYLSVSKRPTRLSLSVIVTGSKYFIRATCQVADITLELPPSQKEARL